MRKYNLAVMLDRGQGVPTNGAEAPKWYMKAAEQGYAPAQNNLGLEFEDGKAVPQDYDEAVKWFRKSARSEAMPPPNSTLRACTTRVTACLRTMPRP
jgi:TPR repeat protein